MLVWLPDVLGVLSRCCLMHLGGSGSESEIFELESIYGERHINFERLLKHDLQLGIVFCQDHLVGAMLWGGPSVCSQNDTIIF